MAFILNIDTSSSIAGICLAKDGKIISVAELAQQKDHAGWLHTTIRSMLEEQGHSLHILDAVAITSGPGSYTGLRVAMATAKGICYALNIPLITENTLRLMAYTAKKQLTFNDHLKESLSLLCPMIDARRMEVFTALYDFQLQEKSAPAPMVLLQESFADLLETNKVIFFGSGSTKFEKILSHQNAVFLSIQLNVTDLAEISENKYVSSDFADLAYSEPEYLKDFFDTTR